MADNSYIINIEKTILSSILYDNSILDNVLEVLIPKDFYLEIHQNIFDAIKKLFDDDKPIDEDFIRKIVPNCDDTLIDILGTSPAGAIESFLEELRDSSKKRELSKIANSIKKMSSENELSATEISDKIKTYLDNLDSDIDAIEDFTGQDILDKHFEKVPLFMTGIDAIDFKLGGIANGQLIYVTGLEETGKTHITYKIMENISYSRKTGIISLEFGEEEFRDRLSFMLKNGNKLTPSNIKATFNCHNIVKLEKVVKKWAKDGCKFIVVDSINLIENHLIRDRFERVLNIGTRLFKLVQQLEITMFVISTSTKEDNKIGNPSIYGGQLLNHYCSQKWHITRNMENESRVLWINKNKQNYKYPKIGLKFDELGNIIEIDSEDTQPQPKSNIDIDSVKNFLSGKDWVVISEMQKSLKADKKEKALIFDMIKNDKDIELKKDGSIWCCKYNNNISGRVVATKFDDNVFELEHIEGLV